MENQQDILKTVIDGLVYIPTKDMIVKPLEDEYVESVNYIQKRYCITSAIWVSMAR